MRNMAIPRGANGSWDTSWVVASFFIVWEAEKEEWSLELAYSREEVGRKGMLTDFIRNTEIRNCLMRYQMTG